MVVGRHSSQTDGTKGVVASAVWLVAVQDDVGAKAREASRG